MTNCACDTFSSATSATALNAANTSTGHAAVFTQTSYNVDAVQISSNASSNSCLYANQTGNGNAISAETTGNGMSLYAWNNGSGAGGNISSTNGVGCYISSTSNYGLYVSSSTNSAIYASVSSSSSSAAISAISNNTTTGLAVSGTANGSDGLGVYGTSSGSSGVGVKGLATGTGYGVLGASTNGIGVYGSSTNSTGVYAASTSGTALYCSGSAAFTGYITKSGGGYRIDHPSDPANKFLNHNFVESPEMMNVYRGSVSLDANGEAVIQLPNYFNDACENPQYALTPIGAAMPSLHVSSKLQNGSFKVSGGVAGAEVSWQLTAARADKWAKANMPPVEIVKKPEEQGLFLHPELFGFGHEKNLDKERCNPKDHLAAI